MHCCGRKGGEEEEGDASFLHRLVFLEVKREKAAIERGKEERMERRKERGQLTRPKLIRFSC